MIKADVSVVIPCFNSETTILRALASVLEQTLRPFEIVVVDDASTDNTGCVISKFIHSHPHIKIRYFRLSINSGPSKARNIGWDNSISKYVAFLDADDTWHPKKIEIQYMLMNDNQNIDICGHKSDLVSSKQDMRLNSKEYFLIFLHHLLIKNRFSTPSVMLKRSISLRFNEGRRYSEDYDLWLNLASQECFIAVIPLTLCFLHKERYGDAGLSKNLINMWRGEVASFYGIWKKRYISFPVFGFFSLFSFLKLLRRFVIIFVRK